MAQSELSDVFRSEAALTEHAGTLARQWRRTVPGRLLIGLRGGLGSGKSTWARAMLHGLGYRGRVPSPTYTLLEHYRIDGLSVVHMDLYRLSGEEELENLGVRDWLAQPDTWLLIEWPERAPILGARCDLLIEFEFVGETSRKLRILANSETGNGLLRADFETDSNNSS
jgi:tRNA threonylcarbamoyladenosine biosynthesis protein TsaE